MSEHTQRFVCPVCIGQGVAARYTIETPRPVMPLTTSGHLLMVRTPCPNCLGSGKVGKP